MKVLVADDARMMRTIIRRCLESLGVGDIDEAEDGAEAIHKFTAGSYDLVLTDWNMPNKDGLQVLREIRAINQQVPVVVITTEGQRGHVTAAIEAGVSGYILKPFEQNELKAKLEAYCPQLS